jgi:alpha-L-fucosidase
MNEKTEFAFSRGTGLQMPEGPFQPSWGSLSQYQVPQWYVNGKFGIFIHWGLYAVPAFGNEWYPRNMYLTGTPEYEHHLKTYGPHPQFGYKDFLPMFTAERFDPGSWAELFRRAGARFVVPVAEHHDGFAMYRSDLTDWCAAKMGPRRDLIGELAEAVRKEWLVFGLSSHRAEHWWFFDGGMQFESDVRDKRYAGLYGPAQKRDTQPNEEFLDDWLARTCELVDRYRPQLLWFDWWIQEPAFAPYLKRFAAYYYSTAVRWGRGVAINYKHQAFPDEAAVFDVERGQLSDIRRLFWQCDTSASKNSWGFIQNHEYKSASAIIGDLADIVSKNGALLLNIGPEPDGTIPAEEERILLEIGGWLAVNGEGIYDSRPWKVYGEGPTEVAEGSFGDSKRSDFTHRDIRYTVRPAEAGREEALYAIVLAEPENREVSLRSLGNDLRLYTHRIGSVELLGSQAELKWNRRPDSLQVKLPETKRTAHAVVLKIIRKPD